jgi:hypothetical protein
VARGFLQYLKLLAVIKDVRSRSKLNQHTPIVSAGLVFNEAPEAPRKARLDAVSGPATLDFMRAHGLDDLVDAYGVHTYPWVDNPGSPAAVAGRQERLQKYVLAECRPEGSTDGKPCWITEWGIPSPQDASCPVPESDTIHQVQLIQETRNNFKPFIAQRKVTGLFYYAWLDQQYGLFRCGALSDAGKLALGPVS